MSEEHDEGMIVREILRGIPSSPSMTDGVRLLKARLRRLGDDIGEPILVEESAVPAHYVKIRFDPSNSPGIIAHGGLSVAMTPAAASSILARC